MSDTAAIVLAAGLSRRIGAANKLLMPIGETALLRGVVVACAAVTDHPVTVVTGHQADAIEAILQDLAVRFAHNSRFEEGQMTSVDQGLRQAPQADSYLVALGDQPRITARCLQQLLSAHHADAGERITVPIVHGQRGNPIVVPAAQRARMLADPMNLGCRKLTRTAPEIVHPYITTNESFVLDIDTADDLARIQKGTAMPLETRQ